MFNLFRKNYNFSKTSFDYVKEAEEEEEKIQKEWDEMNLPDIEVSEIDPELYEHDTFPHTLLYGTPGLGKTTMSNVIVNHLKEVYRHNISFHYFTPSEMNSKAQLDELFTHLKPHDVIMADEIHGFDLKISEAMYSVVQDRRYVVSDRKEINMGGFYIGVDNGSVINEIILPNFTFMGGTTERGLIAQPLEDRFKIILELQPYSEEELAQIVIGYIRKGKAPETLAEYIGQKHAKAIIQMHLEVIANRELSWSVSDEDVNNIITPEASIEIAKRSLRIPRLAKRLTDHVLIYAKRWKAYPISKEIVSKASEMLPLDKNGMSNDNIRAIKALLESNSITLGRDSLASAIGTSKNNVAERIIPQLTFGGWLTRNNRQMVTLTEKAIKEYGWLKEGQ